MNVKEKIKGGYYNSDRIENYVRERVHSNKCILRDTEWQQVMKPKRFLHAYRKSNFKYKEILPLDRLDYVWAKEYLVIY